MFKLGLACVALAVVVVGCGGSAPRVNRRFGEETLVAIKIEGSRAIPVDEIAPGLALERIRKGGRAVDAYQMSLDVDRIRAAYMRLGFFEVEVKARIDTDKLKQTAVFTVNEGRRSKIRVEIRGLPPEVSPAEARALVKLRDGEPFDYAVYEAAKLPMTKLIEDAGYANVVIDWQVLVDRETGIATARFAVEPGPRATFGPITIEGADGELADAMLDRVTIRTGDPFSARAIEASQRALYELNRFSTVRIDPDRTNQNVVPVKISVSVGQRHELRAGFGLGYDPLAWEVRARAGYSVFPLWAPLWTFSADYRPALRREHETGDYQQRHRVSANATRLDLFRPYVTGELELSIDRLEVEAYTTFGGRFRAGIDSALGVPWLKGRAGWLIEYLTFSGIHVIQEQRAALNLDENQRRGAYELAVDADGRDNELQPRKGAFASMRAVLGTPGAGGKTTYLQLIPELRLYAPLGPMVLAGRGRVGLLYGDIPVTERYFSGGSNNHRGFANRQLSPTAPAIIDGEPRQVVIGGLALVEAGLELRIPISTVYEIPYGVNLFVDAGDVVPAVSELDLANLHWATGFGIYLKVFGLKVRGEVGYRLNRTGPGNPDPGDGFWENLAWHLGVGETY